MRIPHLSRGILANPITGATVRSLLPLGLLRNDFEMPGMKHVAILIETSRAYGRGLLRGIARYNREHGQWSTFLQPQGLGDPAPAWLPSWQGDGILARIDNRLVARAVQRAGVPVINMRGTLADLPFPFIGSDNLAIAQLAAEHLLDRGFRHFAFCGYQRKLHPKLDLRGDHFQRHIDTARALLADTDLPVKQVALRAGFKNVQYLTRVFSAIVGQPPAEYRLRGSGDERG